MTHWPVTGRLKQHPQLARHGTIWFWLPAQHPLMRSWHRLYRWWELILKFAISRWKHWKIFFFCQSGKELKLNFRTKARGWLGAGRVLLCYTSFSCQRCNLSRALWVGVSPDWTVKPGVSRRPSPGSGIRSRPEDTECVVLASRLFFFISAIKHVGISIWSYQTAFERNFKLLVHR